MASAIKKAPKEDRKNLSIRISKRIQERLSRFSDWSNFSPSQIVEKVLENDMNENREFCAYEKGVDVAEIAARVPKKKPERAA